MAAEAGETRGLAPERSAGLQAPFHAAARQAGSGAVPAALCAGAGALRGPLLF